MRTLVDDNSRCFDDKSEVKKNGVRPWRLTQGKQGKWTKKKNPCQGKNREFGNFAKTQGILFAQVVNSLTYLNGKGYCDVCRENVHFFSEAG